jgi:hypothetical protein
VEELAETVDGQPLEPEAGVTEKDDRADAHGREYIQSDLADASSVSG